MFANRIEAGRQLADRLTHVRGTSPVVLGLPRGGVPVAAQVAAALHAPLDVVVVRKLRVPFQPELAMGAIAEGGIRFVDEAMLRAVRVADYELASEEQAESAALDDRIRRLRGTRPPANLTGRTAVVVDDGLATGATARVACRAARARGAARVVLAVPVAPAGWAARLGAVADEYVSVLAPTNLAAVGQYYRDFGPTSDAEVIDLLRAAGASVGADATSGDGRGVDRRAVTIRAGSVELPGLLAVPEHPSGIVVFAHGSGSSRHSPRNSFVAAWLNDAGIGTLLVDLLQADEERVRANVFDIRLLAERLIGTTDWVLQQPGLGRLPIGYFGASTGAAAALWAAAAHDGRISAVVSRGGRVDLADMLLHGVHAATLLIVGERDPQVLTLNREAQAELRCDNRLIVVPGASHLFEEPGALQAVAAAAEAWFAEHFAARTQPVG